MIGPSVKILITLAFLFVGNHAWAPAFRRQVGFFSTQQIGRPHMSSLYSNIPDKPLYDGSNYTLPDTTSPEGVAEVLEASFVHACMQLRTGYVDVLKLFIAGVLSSYQFGFATEEVEKALTDCPNDTANRQLLPEEIELRHTWYCLVYLTLLSIDHPTTRKEVVDKSIPDKIKETYGEFVDQIGITFKADNMATISVDELLKDKMTDMSEMERALLFQSLRVATLTTMVVQEALEAGPTGQSPPTPPIKGAFD